MDWPRKLPFMGDPAIGMLEPEAPLPLRHTQRCPILENANACRHAET
jgi:hypothetical protein